MSFMQMMVNFISLLGLSQLFSIYIIPFCDIIQLHGLDYEFYVEMVNFISLLGLSLVWVSSAMCTICFVVVTPHIQRCVDYYSFIIFWCHHTLLGNIYDVTIFQTNMMS